MTAVLNHEKDTITVLDDVLDRIVVDPSRSTAWVDGEAVESPDVRQLESDLGRRLYERLHVGWPIGRNSLARVDRDLTLEARIARTIPATDVELPVRDVRTVGGRTTGVLFGARIVLDEQSNRNTVVLPDSWPALSPGFYMVFGNDRPRSEKNASLWRIYLSANGFGDSLESFTQAVGFLREHGSRWQAKIASSEAVYPRTDAVTVYLDHEDRHHAESLAELIGRRAGRWARTSAMVDQIAPGVGLAQEPADPDPTRRGLSYGQHRASILARVAMANASVDAESTDLAAALLAAGVDPVQYWRNLTPSA